MIEMITKLDIKDYYKCNNIWDMNKNKYLKDKFYNELLNNNRITFIYQKNNEFLGEVSLVFDMQDKDYTIKNKRIYLSRFLVKKEYRHQGIGTKLMEYITNYAKELNYQEMSAGVDLDNYIAIKFYVKNDFNTIIKVDEDKNGKYLKLLKKL